MSVNYYGSIVEKKLRKVQTTLRDILTFALNIEGYDAVFKIFFKWILSQIKVWVVILTSEKLCFISNNLMKQKTPKKQHVSMAATVK